MPSSHPTDPATLESEVTPSSEEAPAVAEGIGCSQEVLSLVNALEGGADDRSDAAQQKADELAQRLDAILRKSKAVVDPPPNPIAAEPARDEPNPPTSAAEDYASLTNLQMRFDALVFEHSETRRERDELARQLTATTSATDAANPRIAETEKALVSIRQARDTVLARNVALNEKLTAAENRIAELEYEFEKAERARDAALALSKDLSQTCDELRQQTLGLTCERDELQQQVNHLIEERAATQGSPQQQSAQTVEQFGPQGEPLARGHTVEIESSAQRKTDGSSKLQDRHNALTDLQGCLQLLAVDSCNEAVLTELRHHLQSFREHAKADGCAALARLSAACDALAAWLCKAPNKIAAALGPLSDAVNVLGEIAAIDRPDRIADPAGALVFAVDDDVDNCECITMALEKIALNTRYAIKPDLALKELAASPWDLIILDVDLPGMNGFDLFSRIRAMNHHENTPIIFLSGVEGSEKRVAALPAGAQVFVPKPYNLNELGLITLRMISKARLAALEERTLHGVKA